MKNARDTIAKIEDTLATTIPEAALKRDLNKMVLALTESVTNLVAVAKEMAATLEGAAPAPAPKPTRAKKPAAKTPTKRVQKQPIAPK